MDVEYDLNESIIIVPKNYKIKLKHTKNIENHYVFFGMGTIVDNYPFFFDATNEYGLSMALLNFKDNAKYYGIQPNKTNLAPYELLLYILSKCKNVMEAKAQLKQINIINQPFNDKIPLAEVHFMISDKNQSVVVETTNEGMKIYDNVYNVLTNNPPFYYHQINVSNYKFLSIENHKNNISKRIKINDYSNGQGAMFLPGDYSSTSRFIKALFIKNNMILSNNKKEIINQFFNCLETVKMIKGVVKTKLGFEYTRYTSCVDVDDLIYYYKIYNNDKTFKIKMNEYDLNQKELLVNNIYG